MQATEMASRLSIDEALRWHLQYNHYPSVHTDFIPIAKKAIWHGKRGHYDKVLKMPNGVSLPVHKIIEGLHLDSWL